MDAGQNDRAAECADARDQLAAVRGTLRMARAFAEMHRPVDLAGLDMQVGRLCAACLDLPPTEGAALRLGLAELMAELDALGALLHAGRAAS